MIKYRTMTGHVRNVLAERVTLQDAFEIVKYDPYEHRLIVPQLYRRTLDKQPLSERWDQVEGFYQDGVFLVLHHDDAYYIGFAISTIVDNTPHITAIGVMPKYRRQGIGTYLVQKISEHYAKLGYSHILVDIKPYGEDFSNRCHKMGFTEVETS